jgi:hypothetical protein
MLRGTGTFAYWTSPTFLPGASFLSVIVVLLLFAGRHGTALAG